MAVLAYTNITDVLVKMFEDRIAMCINRATVLPQLLPVSNGTGQNIQWVVRTGTATPSGAVIGDGTNVSVFNSDTKSAAVLQYGIYHDAFGLTGLALAAAAAAGNPMELAALFGEELEESVTRLASAIAVDLYTGATSGGIVGLVAANGGILATGTYAGIVRGSVAQWAGNSLLNGGVARPLTFDLMREMRRTIYVASGLKPDLIVCSPVQHEKYGALFENERRYVQEVQLRGQTIKLDGGYMALEFDGIPVIEDIHCPDDKMLFLNTSQCHLKQLPSAPDAINRAMGSAALHGTVEEQYGVGSARFTTRIQPLAINGDKFQFSQYVYCQLQVKRPQTCGYIGDLAS
jgi:hypothetical protein